MCVETNEMLDADKLQCAGHMMLKGSESQFVRFVERHGINITLNGRESVFESIADCLRFYAKNINDNEKR